MDQLEKIFNDATDPVFAVNPKGDILWMNSAARASGLMPHEAPPNINSFLSPTDVRNIVSTTHAGQTEVALTTKCQLAPGGKLHALIVDISGSDPAAQRILMTLKTSSPGLFGLNRREEFLSTVAHDLKNPLGAIFGFSDALLDTGSPLTEVQKTTLARIRSTAYRCIDMVKNYQLLSSLQGAVVRKPSQPVNLNTAISAVIEATWRDEAGVPKLILELSPEPLPVNAERIMLDRVVSNLFSNALRYTPPGETIKIITRRDGRQAFLSVQNSGSVIPPEELPHIFERNTRGSTSAGTAGSGLGLFIVKQIVTLLGGTIQAESSDEKGTSFEIYLPIGRELPVAPFIG